MAETYEGYFLIADITGYTRYLSESELEHAQDTLTALLELLVKNTRAPLVISRLAGDAVISYGLLENFFVGQTFIEKIEDTYITFRKTLERLVLNNSCRCNACANIANLDLKFFIHYGTFGLQRIADHDELVGSDVNLLHRLLKNSVTQSTGFQGYALITEAAMRQLDIDELEEAMVPLIEAYEHLGEVKVWVQDMHAVWEKKRNEVAAVFPEERTIWRYEVDIAMPREMAWSYLIQPEYRNIMMGVDSIRVANRSQGRIAPGSIYQCYHGDKVIPQTILEWLPFESMLVKEVFEFAMKCSMLSDYSLTSIEGGTRLTRRITKPDGPFISRNLLFLMLQLFRRMARRTTDAFARQIEDDYRMRSGELGSSGEISGEQIREAAAAGLQISTAEGDS